MRKAVICGLIFLFFGSILGYSSDITRVSAQVSKYCVGIAAYFPYKPDTYNKIREKYIRRRWILDSAIVTQDEKQYMVFFGAGTVIKFNYIVTVAHLFDEEYEKPEMSYVLMDGLDHAVKLKVLVVTDLNANYVDDYALVQPEEDLGLLGAKIGRANPKISETVVFQGCPGGVSFFRRIGFISDLNWMFGRNDNGVFVMSHFGPFPFQIVYPGAPGDSGGGIFNNKGELVGVMYLGLNVHSMTLVMSNPTQNLRDFLTKNGYEALL